MGQGKGGDCVEHAGGAMKQEWVEFEKTQYSEGTSSPKVVVQIARKQPYKQHFSPSFRFPPLLLQTGKED